MNINLTLADIIDRVLKGWVIEQVGEEVIRATPYFIEKVLESVEVKIVESKEDRLLFEIRLETK